MSLPEISVRRPIAIFMATLAVGTFGYLSAERLPVDLLPDLSYPTLTIQTAYPDAAPVSVEQFVTRPVEEAVGVIPGVRDMRSTSRAGLSEVVLEFDWDVDIDFTVLDVREKLGLAHLPDETDIPRVLRFDPSLDPILRLGLSGERTLDDLRQVADLWIKPKLEAVPGVAAAKVRGGLDPEIQIEADEDRLAALGLTLDELESGLRAENINQPGGTIKDFNAAYLVRTLHEFDNLEKIRRTVVRESETGRIRIEDVATVTRGHRDREEITRTGGAEVVEIALHREGSSNTVAVANNVRETIAELRLSMPDDLRLSVLTDQSLYISEAVRQVLWAALIGGILAILVLYFFLRDVPSTIIIALSIPVSVLATFLPMSRVGVSLNIMSLGGLALGIGMLVDNSIVVLESIDRHRREGLDRAMASIRGASDVAGAVTASTLTTVCVFFPIVFVKGIAGQLFYDQAVTVCFSLLASLVVSLTLIPSLAALDPATLRREASSTLFRWDQPDPDDDRSISQRLAGFARRGAPGVRGILRLPVFLVLLPLRLLALIAWLPLAILQKVADLSFPWLIRIRIAGIEPPPIGNALHPTSRLLTALLFPLRLPVFLVVVLLSAVFWTAGAAFHFVTWPASRLFDSMAYLYPGTLQRALRLRWGVLVLAFALFALSIAAVPLLGTNLVPDLTQGEFAFRLTLPEGTPIETTASIVSRIEEPLLGDALFDNVFSVIGSVPSSASGRPTLGENLAQINFVLEEDAGPGAERSAVGRVRAVLSRFSRVDSELVRPSVMSFRPPIAVRVFAEDLDVLDDAAGRVEATVASIDGVMDVASTSEPGSPEIRVELDRERAAAVGLNASDVGRLLRGQIHGALVGKLREGEQRLDIRLRASRAARERASNVKNLRVRLPGGRLIPVSAVARVIEDRGPAAIHRSGGARVAEIIGKAPATDLGRILDKVRTEVAAVSLPGGARAEMAGQDRELQVSFDSLKLAMALAVFLVYVVMAAQFESLLHPFVIITAVPLGVTGIVAGLGMTGTTISVLVFIGAVMLAGIVVNNAIVLVDAVNRRRRSGESLDEAIVGGARERLRPILMTTATTVLGLLPMAIGVGAGSELRAPLAITVIGGLSAATLLTLVVVPCLYRAFSFGAGGQRSEPASDTLRKSQTAPLPSGGAGPSPGNIDPAGEGAV